MITFVVILILIFFLMKNQVNSIILYLFMFDIKYNIISIYIGIRFLFFKICMKLIKEEDSIICVCLKPSSHQ